MWRWFVLSLVLYECTLSQPITEDSDNVRISRQYDFVECCPCPGSKFKSNSLKADPARSVVDIAQSAIDLVRADDCPCRPRAADSDGSSSIILSRTLAPLVNIVGPVDSKEEPKPLLHPEVGLASSFLETLREATDEEYQDALERDAARSAARTSEPDETLDEITDAAKKIVTIIVNPRSTEEDGILSEASDVQEIQVKAKPPNLLKGLLPKPDNTLRSSLFDMNNGASTVKERVESINKGLEELKLRANPKFKLSSTVKPLENTSLNKLKLGSKIPDFRLRPLNITKSLVDLRTNKLNKLAIPKMKLNNAQNTGKFDNNPSPSNMQEQFLDSSEKSHTHFKLTSLLPLPPIKPLNLKNLLNLKDVELIPPKSNKAKLIQPNNKGDYDEKEATETNILVIAKDKSVNTEILDAVPSPSENYQVLAEVDTIVETTTATLEDDIKTADPCIPKFHENDGVANEITSVPKEDSLNSDIETLVSEGESLEIENKDTQQANQESTKEDKSFEAKEDGIGNDQDPATSSPQLDIQEIGSFDYTDEDLEDKEKGHEEQISNTDLAREDYVDQDSLTEASSSNIVQILPHEESKEVIEDVSDERKFNTEDFELDEEEEEIIKSAMPQKSMEDAYITGLTQTESLATCDLDSQSDSSTISQATDIFSNDKSREDTDSHMNIQDLQQLSDSLLDQSNKNKQKEIVNAEESECNTINAEEASMKVKEDTENTSIIDSSDEEIDGSDLNPAATSLDTQILESITRPTESFEVTNPNDNSEMQKAVDGTESEIKACITDLDSLKSSVAPEININEPNSLDVENNQDEMDVEATESLNSITRITPKVTEDNTPGSSIQQNVVVQPSSLFGGDGLDIFRRPIEPLPDLLNMNTKIPTLEEIHYSISSLFGTHEKDTDEDELSSEFDSDNDFSNRNSVMSTDASARSSNTKLPPLKPLEDINIDIFQLNPLSQSSPLTSKLPVLNLNSYKAKLAIPKTLDLKPMKFESALGSKGGLLGATFSVGPKKTGFTRKPIPRTNFGSPLNTKPIILGNPPGNLPTLDDLKISMNTKSSFDRNTRLNPLGDPFRASQTIGDNLRAHTENKVKNIQQSLASTLSEARVRDSDLLGSKLPTPQDLLEKVTLAQDDMNDKLKAIHYDLNDRLTSLHESIVDQTKLPSLSIPIVKDTSLKFTTKPQSKAKSQNKQTSPTQLKSSGMPFKKPSLRVKKPQTDLRLNSPGSYPNREQTLKPFRMSTAASSLTPKSVEVPTLTTIPTKSSFSGLQRDPNVKLKESKLPLFTPKEQKKTRKYNRPNLMKKFKPFGETQVKVSFSTTPRPSTQIKARPVTTSRPILTTKPTLKSEKLTAVPRSNSIRSRPSAVQHKFQLADSKDHASELRPSVIPASKKANTKPAGKVDISKGSILRESQIPKETTLNRAVPSKNVLINGAKKASENKPFKLSGNVQSWPTTTESAFLSKVREALRSRFSSISPSVATEPTSFMDMARSASDNNEVVVSVEPMKENVPYKCKMVCVRDP